MAASKEAQDDQEGETGEEQSLFVRQETIPVGSLHRQYDLGASLGRGGYPLRLSQSGFQKRRKRQRTPLVAGATRAYWQPEIAGQWGHQIGEEKSLAAQVSKAEGVLVAESLGREVALAPWARARRPTTLSAEISTTSRPLPWARVLA